MKRFATLFIVLIAQPLMGEELIGRIGNVAYSISDGGHGIFRTNTSQWLVFCEDGICDAHTENFGLHLDDTGLTIESHLPGIITIWKNRTSQSLRSSVPLEFFERATLLSGGDLVIVQTNLASIENPTRYSIDGIETILRYMEISRGDVALESPISHLELLNDQHSLAPPQLVPFTKPQIEFAIRAQQDDD